MRWKLKTPKVGDRRVINKFLWWPYVDNNGNVRWLEWARILQIYSHVVYGDINYSWWNYKFLESGESE